MRNGALSLNPADLKMAENLKLGKYSSVGASVRGG